MGNIVILHRPAAVLFDMDGLLLDTERISRTSMIEVMRAMGFPMTEAIFETLIGVPVDQNRLQLEAVFGPTFDYALMRERQHTLNTERYGFARPLRPGAREVLETVADLGIPRAVATSSLRAKTLSHLEHSGLGDLIDVVVARDEVERGKPFPDLYLAAAAALGQVPADCLAIEDSHNGVRAAHGAGVPVVMVPDLLPATDEMHGMALAIAPDLLVVRDWLLASG